MTDKIAGGCLCGEMRYETVHEPTPVRRQLFCPVVFSLSRTNPARVTD